MRKPVYESCTALAIEAIKNTMKPVPKKAMQPFFYSFAALLLFSFYAKAQQSNPFISGFEKSSTSKILGEQRRVWIHIPNRNGGNTKTGKGNYPVIYLLDGDENFNSVVAMTEFMSEADLCPPMIVVGIIHQNRMLELTVGSDKDFPVWLARAKNL